MTLPDNEVEEAPNFETLPGQQGKRSSEIPSGSNDGLRRSSSIKTPRGQGYRNRSVMSDNVLSDSRLSFLPIIRRSSMASSIASSIKSSSLYSSSTGSSSPMSGPPTGFSSPSKLVHFPKLLLREMQPGYFDMQDEMAFNRCMRLPQLDSSPTDCRLNLVAQKLQEGAIDPTTPREGQELAIPVPAVREVRGSRESEREAAPKRKRRKNRKRSEQRQKSSENDRKIEN